MSREHSASAVPLTLAIAELPTGWMRVRLGEVARLQPGYAFKSEWFSESGVRLLRGTNIVPGGTRWDESVYLPLNRVEEFKAFALAEGDIVIAMDRPIVSDGLKVAQLSLDDVPSLLLQRVGRFVPSGAIVSPFLMAHLNSSYFLGHVGLTATGTQLPHISGTDVETAPLALPPLAEQRRIVAKLDELRARSRRAREALDEVPALLAQLKHSVLAAAFRGDLTADWREKNTDVEPASVLLDRIRAERRRRWEQANPKKTYLEPEPVDTDGLPDLPDGWCWSTFAALVDGVRSGTACTAVREDTGFRVLRSSAVRPGVVDFEDYSFLPDAPSAEEVVSVGDLLVTRLSGSLSYVGNGGLVRVRPNPAMAYPDRLFRSRPHVDVAPWLELSLGVSFLRRDLESAAKSTAGHQRISQGDLMRFPVPVPSVAEQREAVRAVSTVMSAALALADSVRTGATDLDSLDQSILAKAFRGELVPQDPNDEPADVLLARIKAETRDEPARRGRGRPAARAKA